MEMKRAGSIAPSLTNNMRIAIRTLNEKLLHDERISLSLLPVADGITFALKRNGA